MIGGPSVSTRKPDVSTLVTYSRVEDLYLMNSDSIHFNRTNGSVVSTPDSGNTYRTATKEHLRRAALSRPVSGTTL